MVFCSEVWVYQKKKINDRDLINRIEHLKFFYLDDWSKQNQNFWNEMIENGTQIYTTRTDDELTDWFICFNQIQNLLIGTRTRVGIVEPESWRFFYVVFPKKKKIY